MSHAAASTSMCRSLPPLSPHSQILVKATTQLWWAQAATSTRRTLSLMHILMSLTKPSSPRPDTEDTEAAAASVDSPAHIYQKHLPTGPQPPRYPRVD
ncbi:hypothetical protein ACJ73_09143 [Blastomyces percursus]|uniref:Uncharacterized protein n=1 Tax=Blastomyces percursus TaxID=1658174 RepID=A0A1J9PBJ4_9EURO|nr:hypothetical protein ACJ73_09143 [Blastomyces percursus]